MPMKMNVTKLIGAAALFALPLAASAAENFSYRYVDVARFVDAEIDSDRADVDGDGIQLRGSLPVYQNFFAVAEYQSLDLDGGVDATRLLIGGGGHWPLGPNLDLVARGGLVNYDVDYGRFGSDDDTGLFVGARIRTEVAPKIEVEAGVEHFEFEVDGLDGDTYIIGEARYNFTSQWSAGAIITLGGDESVIGAQGRFNF
jgi:hypothetical protein